MKRKRGLRRLSVKTFILAIQSPCTIQGCYFDHPSIYLIFFEAQKSDLEKSVIYDLRFHGLNFWPNFLFFVLLFVQSRCRPLDLAPMLQSMATNWHCFFF